MTYSLAKLEHPEWFKILSKYHTDKFEERLATLEYKSDESKPETTNLGHWFKGHWLTSVQKNPLNSMVDVIDINGIHSVKPRPAWITDIQYVLSI